MADKPKLAIMRQIKLLGPECPSGHQYCVLCIMRYKAKCVEVPECKQAIEQSEAGIGPDVLDLRELCPDVAPPELAIGMAMSAQLGQVIVPLCWTHAAGVNFTQLQTAPAGLDLSGGNGRR